MTKREIAVYEDARSMANIAVWSVNSQIQRLRKGISGQTEIKEFIMQPVADFHYLVISLSRLRQMANLISEIYEISDEIKSFDKKLSDLRTIRNILEHIDEYRVGKGNNKSVPASSFQTIQFRNDCVSWVGYEINLISAMNASSKLFAAIKNVPLNNQPQPNG